MHTKPGHQYLSILKLPATLHGKVNLPASKSISNRALIIRALCLQPFIIQNLSDADDTVLLQNLFASGQRELYVKNAGTVARFLLAYYASIPSDVVLTGGSRMQERPIGELVNALKNIGATIDYNDKEGYLPVHIIGNALKGGHISMAASTSSQFISAMLMIAPAMQNGLTIELTGEIVSEPYIDLTLEMMAGFGITYRKENQTISIPPQTYKPNTFFVEADWSSASYFFALAALYPGCELVFDNLFDNSLQGDAVLVDIMKRFGMEMHFEGKQCRVKSGGPVLSHFSYDFINHPDLIPTFVCLCCALNVSFEITGSRTLQYKESNRALVLQTELAKLGYVIDIEENSITSVGVNLPVNEEDIILNTYDDHRMAMSFAILASKNSKIHIENPGVVEKSFPAFWNELARLSFETMIK